MALDDREARVALDGAEHGDIGVVLDHEAQLRLVPAAAKVVEDHAGDADVAVERLVAEDQRRDAARHAAGVDDQDHRQVEHLRHRRVAVAAVEGEAVVEALVALDDRDVGGRCVAHGTCRDTRRCRTGTGRGCGSGGRWPRVSHIGSM